MVVPIEVKGHKTSAVVDGGAQVSIINQGLFEGLNYTGPREPVRLKGIALTKALKVFGKGCPFILGWSVLSLGSLCCSY